MYIGNDNIYFKPITTEDSELIIRWRNSNLVRPFFIDQNLFTLESHMKWFESMIMTQKAFQFIVYDKKTDRPFGCAYLRDYDRANKKIEYGTFIGEKDCQGKGYGTQMAEIACEYAFNNLDIHKVFARVISSNKASSRSFEKAGFTKEAYLEDEVIINGEYKDIIFYAKICGNEG